MALRLFPAPIQNQVTACRPYWSTFYFALTSDTSSRHPGSKSHASHHKKIQPPPDTFSVSPVSKGINHNEERPTMDTNDLFDGIMKSINQFADEIAEQRLQKKMQESGRGPENGGEECGEFGGESETGYDGFPEKGVIG
jgi:hypothetical protein